MSARRQKKPAPKSPPKKPPKVIKSPKEKVSLRRRAKTTADIVARTPKEAEAVMVAAQEAPLGFQIMEDMMRGMSMQDIAAHTGMSAERIQEVLSHHAAMAPDTHKAMIDGMRGFLSRVFFDDLMRWRSKTWEAPLTPVVNAEGETVMVPNIEVQKVAVTSYHNAKSTLIQVYGLAKQTLEVTQAHTREPLPIDELQAMASRNAKLAAAAVAVGLRPPSEEEKR
jgi:hypothetical protein